MTNEEAIMVLGMVDAYGLADEAKKVAIKAIEKQIPKKPDHINNGFPNSEDRWRCPSCTMLIMAMYRGNYTHGHQADYCEWCGQRIDWSEDD